MKFIASADLHIHSKVPKNRIGNYFEQVMKKFKNLLEITAKYSDENLLVVAGDFFDSSTVSYKVTRSVMEILMNTNIQVLVVPGQHDLRYHVGGLDNTPLGILQTSGQVTILNPETKVTVKGVSFIGTGWNEELKSDTMANVIITHQMVTKKGPLWEGQINYSSAHAIMRKYPWADCIISGDNHMPHSLRIKGDLDGHRLQINCGSLVRSTKSQVGFQPRAYLIDCVNWKAKAIKIPCLPDTEVFDFSKIAIEELKGEAKEHAEAKIAEFINMLPKNQKEKPEFKSILNNIVSNINPRQGVKTIIANTMEKLI